MKNYLFFRLLIIIFLITFISCSEQTPIAKFCSVKGQNAKEIVFSSFSESAESYQWEFGDNTFSTDANPSHKYLDYKQYNVKLTVTNKGKKHSIISTVDVNKDAEYIVYSDNDFFKQRNICLRTPNIESDCGKLQETSLEAPKCNDTNKYLKFKGQIGEYYLWVSADNDPKAGYPIKINFEEGKCKVLKIERTYGIHYSIPKNSK